MGVETRRLRCTCSVIVVVAAAAAADHFARFYHSVRSVPLLLLLLPLVHRERNVGELFR